ncbi:MAG: L-threonylcarbamoyladenylate synthase [bacterium]
MSDEFEKGIEKASILISNGEVIAVPTDTVYGLLCGIFNTPAIEKIFELKQRDSNKPLVAFCKSIEEIERLCYDIPDIFYILAKRFLPGPLTIVLKRNKNVLGNVCSGMDTIAVRIPYYKFINKLMDSLEFPLASTSANISEEKTFVHVTDVIKTFSGQIPLIIDGGRCPLGIESTVIDLTAKEIKIVREGFIRKEQLAIFFNNYISK